MSATCSPADQRFTRFLCRSQRASVSCLVGVAVDEGYITSIEDPISKYIPVQPNSAYDRVTIKNVLQMSSGARWNENYNDPNSDIIQLGQATFGKGGGLDGFITRMVKKDAPDVVCRYNSGETQVLGALVAHATKRSLTEYMNEQLVQPLGFESPSFWITDMLGTEMSYAGLNLTARDYAKLGGSSTGVAACGRESGLLARIGCGRPQQSIRQSARPESPLSEATALISATATSGGFLQGTWETIARSAC